MNMGVNVDIYNTKPKTLMRTIFQSKFEYFWIYVFQNRIIQGVQIDFLYNLIKTQRQI